MRKTLTRSALASAGGACAVSIALLGFGGGAGAASPHPARPHVGPMAAATGTAPVPFQDVNRSATAGWCTGAPSGTCNGAEGQYGTIDLVPSMFSGGGAGNYAPATKSVGGAHMAVAYGTQDVDQSQGCPSMVTEYCTGPYRLFDGTGTDSKFTSFTVTHMIYLDPTTAAPNSEIDEDLGLNTSAGGYGVDNVVGFCLVGGGWAIVSSHSSPAGCGSGPAVIAAPAWVRTVFVTSNVAGSAYLTENVWARVSGHLTKVWTSGPQPVEFPGDTSAEPVSAVGGPGYFWEPTLNLNGFLPETDLALQSGQHPQGMAP